MTITKHRGGHPMRDGLEGPRTREPVVSSPLPVTFKFSLEKGSAHHPRRDVGAPSLGGKGRDEM